MRHAKVQELVAGLGIKYGFERSFRTSARQLLTNRFLLGFRKQRLGAAADQRILEASRIQVVCCRATAPRC